jgi:hypothetical protein
VTFDPIRFQPGPLKSRNRGKCGNNEFVTFHLMTWPDLTWICYWNETADERIKNLAPVAYTHQTPTRGFPTETNFFQLIVYTYRFIVQIILPGISFKTSNFQNKRTDNILTPIMIFVSCSWHNWRTCRDRVMWTDASSTPLTLPRGCWSLRSRSLFKAIENGRGWFDGPSFGHYWFCPSDFIAYDKKVIFLFYVLPPP